MTVWVLVVVAVTNSYWFNFGKVSVGADTEVFTKAEDCYAVKERNEERFKKEFDKAWLECQPKKIDKVIKEKKNEG